MYFDLAEQMEKCIIEEIPNETLVTGEGRLIYLIYLIYHMIWCEVDLYYMHNIVSILTIKKNFINVVLLLTSVSNKI